MNSKLYYNYLEVITKYSVFIIGDEIVVMFY